MSEKKAFVQSVDRSLQILELFSEQPTISLIEISESVHLAKTTTFGLLATLEKRNFIEQDDATGRYRIGMRLIELASISARRTDIVREAGRLLRPITEKKGHNAHITTLDGMSVVYVGHMEPMNGDISIKTNIGGRAPANCTSSGKAFLAQLPPDKLDALLSGGPLMGLTPQSKTDPDQLRTHLKTVAEQGYATDLEESITGVTGVGVAVRNREREPVLGLSIAGLSAAFDPETIATYAKLLQTAAHRLEVFLKLQTDADL